MRKQSWLEGYMWPCTHVRRIVKPSAFSTKTSISGWTIGQRRELPSKRCSYASSKKAENMSHATPLQINCSLPLKPNSKWYSCSIVSWWFLYSEITSFVTSLNGVCLRQLQVGGTCTDGQMMCVEENTYNELQHWHHATHNIMIQSESYQKFIIVLHYNSWSDIWVTCCSPCTPVSQLSLPHS